MSEHTPGPWDYMEKDAAIWADEFICVAPHNPADARLIAAAPDLLAALEEAFNHYAGQPVPSQPAEEWWPDWMLHARAAIAKAKGHPVYRPGITSAKGDT